MCKAFPAPRCKKHAGDSLTSAQTKYDAAVAETAAAEAALQEAIDGDRAQARIRSRLNKSRKQQQQALDKLQVAQLSYDSTTTGQKQIEKLLGRKDISYSEHSDLQARLDTAHAYRVWQQRCAAKLKEFEAKGEPDAALAWAQREQKAMVRRVSQIETEIKAKWMAEQAKKFSNLPVDQQLEVILRKSVKIYYRLNRYRSLYKALNGDLSKLVTRYGNTAVRKIVKSTVNTAQKRAAEKQKAQDEAQPLFT